MDRIYMYLVPCNIIAFMAAPPAPCSLFLPSSPGKKICRRTSTVPRKPESAPQVSSCLARSSVDLYQASCSSIHTLLLIPLPCKHTCMLPTQAHTHTHTRAIHPCTMAETAGHGCSRPTASLPCKPALRSVPCLPTATYANLQANSTVHACQ